jgi:hypothetical protein
VLFEDSPGAISHLINGSGGPEVASAFDHKVLRAERSNRGVMSSTPTTHVSCASLYFVPVLLLEPTRAGNRNVDDIDSARKYPVFVALEKH